MRYISLNIYTYQRTTGSMSNIIFMITEIIYLYNISFLMSFITCQKLTTVCILTFSVNFALSRDVSRISIIYHKQ